MITKNHSSTYKRQLGCHVDNIKSTWIWDYSHCCFLMNINYIYHETSWHDAWYFNKPPTVRLLRKMAKKCKRDYYKNIKEL